ncbi:MAG: FAD-binding oxidoreductase [Ignavibacteria bacterium]|nr:FAD-binding oxidoreductase [Ignavibacteria bacterium]
MTELRNLIGDDRVSTQLIDRLAFAHDASLYRLVPQAVVRPASVEHIQQLLAWCIRTSSHLTFRAAGTSLSGQAVTDGILDLLS